jgi:O-antigen/teichoic acid export membrane protein
VFIQTKPIRAEPQKQTIASNTAVHFLGQIVRLCIQTVYFLLMARCLGSTQYGTFVAVTSMAAVVYPFVGNGCGNLMIKCVARDPRELSTQLGNSLLLTTITGVILSVGLIPVCRWMLPNTVSLYVIIFVIISDLLAIRFVDVSAWAFQAVEQLKWTACITALVSLLRLCGLVAVILLGRNTIIWWSGAYLITAILASTSSLYFVIRQLGWPRPHLGSLRANIREGFFFSSSLSAQTVYNDLDKSMLARYSSVDATGIYAAAYRLIDVSFVPVKSLLAASYSSFFRAGTRGINSAAKFGRSMLLWPLLYSVGISVVLFFGAPLVPSVLGRQFTTSAIALRWLALLPILKVIHSVGSDILTSADRQGLRTSIQAAVAVGNISLNMLILPVFGWRGAAWTSLACDGILAVVVWVCVVLLTRHKTSPRAAPNGFIFSVGER